MRKVALPLVVALCVVSGLACTISIPFLPDVGVPQLEVGAVQEYEEEVPREDVEEARVSVRFGAGEFTLSAADPDVLFAGQFRTNVEQWAPEVTWRGGLLRIEQGRSEGIAQPGAENEWDLAFSPAVDLEMDLELGASDGELDFTGLSVTRLDLSAGASDLTVRFGEPNGAQMEDLTIRGGATSLRVEGIGNAGPERMKVEGGVGNVILDFSGEWARSAQVDITGGTGSFTLRVPENVGARIDIEGGLSNVETEGLSRSGGAYVNEAYGETEVELLIEVRVGVGRIEIISAGE